MGRRSDRGSRTARSAIARSSIARSGIALLALAAAAVVPAPAAAQAPDWPAVFRRDLEAAHAAVAANHPGVVDPANPGFRRTLQAALDEARRAADSVRSFGAYRVALDRWAGRFGDDHLFASFREPSVELRTPGIYPVWRGGRFVVGRADERYGPEGVALVGGVLRDCDGVPAEALYRRQVLAWRGRPGVEADRVRLAPTLLVDYGPPAPRGPARCTVVAGGRAIDTPLRWAPTTEWQVEAERDALVSFPERPPAFATLEDGRVLWARLPTFDASTPALEAALGAVIDSLASAMQRNGRWRLLVLDLRGNSGGSTVWADQLVTATFGATWADAARAWLRDGVHTEWRVSPDNLAALEAYVGRQTRAHGAGSVPARYFEALARAMRGALARGDSLVGRPSRRAGPPRPRPLALPGRIVALTSASCTSACLDFLDQLAVHPSVVQAGEPTGVDTDYMEVRRRDLPSRLTVLGSPMAVYRGRRRAAGSSYHPSARFDGALNDDAAVRRWLVERFLDTER